MTRVFRESPVASPSRGDGTTSRARRALESKRGRSRRVGRVARVAIARSCRLPDPSARPSTDREKTSLPASSRDPNRAGKTDYYARQRLTLQDKNKYNSKKYRFSVRFTNRDVICQVIYATIQGDVTICSAYSHELPKFGMKAGLTNYAATYATGLLCARRLLTKYGLAETYEGNTENLGDDYHVEAAADERRPFKCFLDTGLVRTSTGSRVFAALKGAVDGGLDIPHNDKRYAGYDLQDKSLDPDTLERYIKGGVVAEYAEEMADEEPEKYAEHFAKYIAEDFEPVDLEEAMEGVLDAIREDPVHVKKARSKPADAKSWKPKKLTYDERKANLKAKLEAIVADA